jgi:hypothetical protein
MPDACPNDELLAAYIEQTLLPAEQAQLESHLLKCKLCREVIAVVIRTRAKVPDPQISPPFKL